MALISGSTKGNMPMDPRTCRYQDVSTGSGSRPVPSKIKIPDSSPEDAHTLGRDVPGSLK